MKFSPSNMKIYLWSRTSGNVRLKVVDGQLQVSNCLLQTSSPGKTNMYSSCGIRYVTNKLRSRT
jgi:hypothetical protein